MKKKNNEKIFLYALIAVSAAVLLWSIFNTLQINSTSNHASGCGDLTDLSNIQHLSHHPQQYAECIKLVSDEKFQQAVGISKSQFMQQNGIK